jgi:uncharacterized protein
VNDELVRYAREGRTLDHIPVFDAHSHFGKWAGYEAIELDDYLAEMDRLGVGLMAVSGLLALSGDMRRGNDQVAEALRRHPGRFVGYVHVNPRFPEIVMPELERCFAVPGFRGIKVYQVGIPYDDPLFEPVWSFARERGVPVLAHTWGGSLTGLDHAAQTHPEVSFMAAHAGSDLAYRAYIDAAMKSDNLYLDLTYSRDHVNLIECFVESVGARKIVWGSDAPLFSMAQQISKVLFAQISDEDKKMILYGTAARLFRLQTP